MCGNFISDFHLIITKLLFFLSFFLSHQTLFHAIRIWRAQNRNYLHFMPFCFLFNCFCGCCCCRLDRCLCVVCVCFFSALSLNTSLDLRMRYSFYSVAARFKTNVYCRNKRLIHEIVVFFFGSFSISSPSPLLCCVNLNFIASVRVCIESLSTFICPKWIPKICMFLKHSHTNARSLARTYDFGYTHSQNADELN